MNDVMFPFRLEPNDLARLLAVLAWVADHGGGESRLPECAKGPCASCDACHLYRLLRAQVEAS